MRANWAARQTADLFWARQVQQDGGERPGQTSAENARIKELGRENRELRQANAMLKKGEPVKAPLVQAHWRTRILPRCERQRGTASALPLAARPPVPRVTVFIEEHCGLYGVEPMCKIPQIAPSTYYDRRAIARDADRASARARSDAALSVRIDAVWEGNRKLYAARKIWHVLRREGEDVAWLARSSV